MNQLITEYGVIALELFENLAPIYESKNDIKINDEFYNKSQAEINRLIEEMRRLNESGKKDQVVMDALQQSFDFQMGLSKRYADERATAWSNFNHYNIAFQKRFLVFIKEVSRKNIPMIIEIRRDLGLSGELVDFEAQMKEQEIRLEASLNKLIQNFEKQLAEDKAE
jgi:hypothetical protein